MKIEKSFEIAAAQEEVWEFVSAPERVGACFPGCLSVESLGDDKYRAAIKVELGPIRTVFNVAFEETEKRPIEFSRYSSRGEEENKASRLKAESTLTLAPLGAGRTRVEYTSEVSIVGRLGKFGAGMMQKKADSISDEFVQALRAEIEGPGAVAAPPPAAGTTAPAATWRRMALAALAAAVVLLVYFIAR